MTKDEATKVLKEYLGKYATKYPNLVVRLQPYIRKHFDSNIATGEILIKLGVLDKHIEEFFFKELTKQDENSPSNRETLHR